MSERARSWAGGRNEGLSDLRRRLAEVEAWKDGPVKDLGRAAVQAELARLGRAMVELEWKWA